ncbi:MAG: FAD-binding oxidoreductase [Candidatus Pacebacteria bacterium]|nr:FAD-binding oxidoreductase [Candidatus Paceibacterota bacterium]MBP9715657.1 FAD-binding oxidoreductase [Candidatus Paceibacterota bacterium]
MFLFKSDLKRVFKGDIEDSEEILKTYSRDASLLVVFPQAVVFPKDTNDIKNLVIWVNKKNIDINDEAHKLTLTARSAGTCMAGGAIGESIIIDFTRYMNAIEGVKKVLPFSITPKYPNAHDVEITGEATVLPGCYYRDFEPRTLEHGLLLPCYTASKSLNAVGGMVGNNSAGEKTLGYGKTEDYIKELDVVFTDGREYKVRPLNKKELYAKIAQGDFEGDVYKNIFAIINDNKNDIKNAKPNVSKNSAGYYLWNVWDAEKEVFDLTKLIVGSQGTLGLVTKITFHLVKVKPASKLVAVFMKDLTELGSLVDRILTHNPESLESYDDATMKLAIKFFPDFLKKKGIFGMIKFMWSFLPEAMLMTWKGFPKLVLLVEFAGESEKEIDQKAKDLAADIKSFGFGMRITSSQSESEKYWDIRRESFALLRKHVQNLHTAPFIDDIIVKPELLPEFLPKLRAILDTYPITYTVAGHAGNGNFHIIPLMDFKDEKTVDIILELSDKVYNLILEYKGSTNAEHNDGIIRTPFLEQMYGKKVYGLFEQTKKIFDEKNIFNPGKKVGATKQYIRDHIVREGHEHSHKI